jgi:hypothetical protein
VAYNGKLYVQTDRKLYCFGKKGNNPSVAAVGALKENETVAGWPKIEPGPATRLQVIPSEMILTPGEAKQVRVRSLDGAPLALMTTWVPESVATFTRRQLSETPMLKLLEGAGVTVAHADQSISAQLADTTVAPLLDVGYGAALLAVNRLVRDDSGRAVQLLHGLYRPDRYEYRMSLDRTGDATRVWVSRDDEHDQRKPASPAPRQIPREAVHA